MSRDPILDEVRAIRDSIAREHDYDLASIFRMLQQAERDSALAHVSPPPPKVAPTAAAAVQPHVAADEPIAPIRSRR
jgi:hypothetical protein